MSESKQNQLAYVLGLGTQFGLMIAATLALTLIAGVCLDKLLHTKPLFILLGVIIGIAASILEIFNVVIPILEKNQKVNNNQKNKENKQP